MTSEWRDNEGERARRYDSITTAGKQNLADFRADWDQFAATVGGVLNHTLRPGRTWLIAAVVVTLVVIAGLRTTAFLTAGPLDPGPFAGWWYAQDDRHNMETSANDSIQSTTPIRSGQRQGYFVEVYNGTDVTQTITGDGSGPSIGWNNPGGVDEQIAVSQNAVNSDHSRVGYRFAPTGVIPPHQSRLVRVLWTSEFCLQKGESQGQTRLILRVRVGWFTRTEVIPLSHGFYLVGPSQGRCTG